MKRILLVDMNSWVGHHRPYFLLYTKLLLKLNYQVDVLCLGEEDIKLYFPQEIIAETVRIRKPELSFFQKITLKFIKIAKYFNTSLSTPNLSTLGMWWFVKNVSRLEYSRDESFVFILDLQGYLVDISLFWQKYILPKAWAGLYIWTPPQDEFSQRLQSNLPIYHSSCKSLCLLNERLVEELSGQSSTVPVHHFPDVSYLECNLEEPPLVLEILEVADGRKIVFLASLTKKHGLIHFLHLADEMFGSKVLFCAMGLLKLDEYTADELTYINNRLSSPPSNLLIIKDIYPIEETLNSLYKIADIAFVCYENFPHSSNKLTKAIGLGTPVIVASDTLLAERVATYQLGVCVDPNNVPAMADATRSLLDTFEFDKKLRGDFINYHSEEMLLKKLAEII